MAKVSSALLKRRLEIAEIVRTQGEVKVDELSDLLAVSNVTIRQDLTYLERQGYLKRSFGGAIYITPENSITNNYIINQNTLQNICNARDVDLVSHCLKYIHDGDTLFLSHGGLIRKLIPFLHSKKLLTLIVNDLETAKLANVFLDAEIILVGGTLLENDVLQNNKILNFILSQYQISFFIIELNSISCDNELIIENIDLASTYKAVLKKADKTIAVIAERGINHGKNSLGDLSNIHRLILSNLTVTEYHQQLLDAEFRQLNPNKYCTTYQPILEELHEH